MRVVHLNLGECEPPLRVESIFGRRAPLEIEIGVGKGRFLKERAAARPERDFLGLEKSRKWVRHAAERICKAGLPNVRLVETYAEPFLERFVPDGAVSAYHIYFPDPWPKARHQKRRLVQPPLLEQVIRTLRADGELFLATDHAEYLDRIRACFDLFEGKGLRHTLDPKPLPHLSNFQVKYLREGRPLSFLRARRVPA